MNEMLNRRRLTGLAALTVTLALASCSTQGANGPTSSAQATSPAGEASSATEGPEPLGSITVAEVQGLPAEFLTFGISEGYFEDEGLQVEVNAGAGGAANMPQLVAGEAQFAGSNAVSVMLAAQEGLDIKMVAPGTFGGDQTEHGYQNLMVSDPEITSVADLEGRTVAVNTLNNIDEVLVRATLEANGVDASTVSLVEMPFPEMGAALAQGHVDAVRIIEPFATRAASGGARFLEGGTTAAVKPFLQIGSYVTTGAFLEEDPEVVEAFQAGLATTAARVTEDPQALRDWLVENGDMEQELADSMVLPGFSDTVHVESLETLGELIIQYGFADEVPVIEEFVAD